MTLIPIAERLALEVSLYLFCSDRGLNPDVPQANAQLLPWPVYNNKCLKIKVLLVLQSGKHPCFDI